MSIESVMPSNHLILCHLLLVPSIFPSIRVFSNESAFHIRLSKYWSFSFIISPSSEYSGLISLRMDWLDLLTVQGTLKSLLQPQFRRTLLYCCTIVSWLLFLCFPVPSVPCLTTVWICLLVLREGLGGWSLFFADEKQGTQKVFLYQEGPTGSCSVSKWYHCRLNYVPLKIYLLRS